MKKARSLFTLFILSVALILLLPTAACAASADTVVSELTEDFTELLPEEFAHYPDDIDALIGAVGIHAILEEAVTAIRGEGSCAVSLFLICISLSLMMSLASVSKGASEVAEAAIGAVGTALIFTRLYPAVAGAKECLSQATGFFGAAIPVLTGISSASGSALTASSQAAAMSLALSIVSGVCVGALLPLAAFGAALGLLGGLGDGSSRTLADGVKGLFMWLTGISSAVITGAAALQTVIATAADTAAVRAAKYGAAGLIPIVGGTVSSTLTTLTAGVSYLKSAVGMTAVAVLISVLISPLVTLLVYRGAISLAITVSGYFGAGASVRMLGALRSALDAVCATFSLSVTVFILQLVLFMRGGAQI